VHIRHVIVDLVRVTCSLVKIDVIRAHVRVEILSSWSRRTQVVLLQGWHELCNQPADTQCLPILQIRSLPGCRNVSRWSDVTMLVGS